MPVVYVLDAENAAVENVGSSVTKMHEWKI